MSRLERNGRLLQEIASDLRRTRTVNEVLEILSGTTRSYIEYWHREVSNPQQRGRYRPSALSVPPSP